MTTRYTDEEWRAIISDMARELEVWDDQHDYPAVDSVEFARTIDHTLLKPDAKPNQIDQLCAEARVYKFAVCLSRAFPRATGG